MGKTYFAKYLVLLTITAMACGCGDGNPKTYPVSGTVTLDGKPVPKAMLLFTLEGSTNKASTTLSDDQGKYALSTFKQGDGAVPGKYIVTVSKFQRGPEDSPYDDPPGQAVEQTPEAISEAYGKGYSGPPKAGQAKAPKEWNDLPAKYANPALSGLTFTVEAKASNTYDIDLKSK